MHAHTCAYRDPDTGETVAFDGKTLTWPDGTTCPAGSFDVSGRKWDWVDDTSFQVSNPTHWRYVPPIPDKP